MDFLKSKHRLSLYLFLLAVLAVGALAAVWSVSGTGAYLTGESDWQGLAGDYRIGTIDYTVRVNDELLLGRVTGGDSLKQYQLAVPLLGGVKMFDPDPDLTATVLAREFNEGATLMRVRVANYSKNMVDVTAQFTLHSQTSAGVPPIRALPLPATLTQSTAATTDYRTYILKLLTPYTATKTAPQNLTELESAYNAYLSAVGGNMVQEMGLLPGSTATEPSDGSAVQDGNLWCYYKDVFFIVWSEYGDGEYNETVATASPVPTRQGRFDAVFTVGQLD